MRNMFRVLSIKFKKAPFNLFSISQMHKLQKLTLLNMDAKAEGTKHGCKS